MRNKLSKFDKISKSSTLKNSLFSSPSSRLLKLDCSKMQKPLSLMSIELKNSQMFTVLNSIKVLEQKDKNGGQFIPTDIKLVNKSSRQQQPMMHSSSNNFMNQSMDLMTQTFTDQDKKHYSDFFIEDFVVVGPDTSQFKTLRSSQKGNNELKISPSVLYNF